MDQYLNEPKPTWTPWDEDEALHAMIMYDAFEPIDLFEDESDYEIPDAGLPLPSSDTKPLAGHRHGSDFEMNPNTES